MLTSQALIQEIELACKAGAPNPAEIVSKFAEAKAIIEENLEALTQVKAEKEANL
jgi:hypothetical protein